MIYMKMRTVVRKREQSSTTEKTERAYFDILAFSSKKKLNCQLSFIGKKEGKKRKNLHMVGLAAVCLPETMFALKKKSLQISYEDYLLYKLFPFLLDRPSEG